MKNLEKSSSGGFFILSNGLVLDSCQTVLRFEQTKQANHTSIELCGQFAQQNADKQNVNSSRKNILNELNIMNELNNLINIGF